jgi:hypothetical protein
MEEEHGCRALSLVKVPIRFWRVFAFGHLHAKQSVDAAPRRAPRANCRPHRGAEATPLLSRL